MTLNAQEFSFRQSRDDINQLVFIFFKNLLVFRHASVTHNESNAIV